MERIQKHKPDLILGKTIRRIARINNESFIGIDFNKIKMYLFTEISTRL